MLIIGLTGGIGSGKSVASDKFKSLGITVVDADVAARTVVKPGMPALKKIEDYFGSGILTAKGELDRNKLREIIASDPEKREWLESVLHPRIGEQIKKEISESTSAYTLFVAPLLFETNSQEMCSRVIVVDVPTDTQILRTSKRDKVSPDQVRKMVDSQMKREKRLEKADDVLLNIGSMEDLERKVEEMHKKYLEMV